MNTQDETSGLVGRVHLLPMLDSALHALGRVPILDNAINALARAPMLDNAINALGRAPIIGQISNRVAISTLAYATQPRPRPYSLFSNVPQAAGGNGPITDYTSWPALTDRSFSGRHLPPASPEEIARLPIDRPWTENSVGEVTALFQRTGSMKNGRSTALFMFFAQWFTDSFLRIDASDRRRNTSNHEIDLCQIYGLTEATAAILRSHRGGKLKSLRLKGEEYPDYLMTKDSSGKWRVKDEYQELPYVKSGKLELILANVPEDRQKKLYATGLERGNSSIGYVALSTLFLREHNRLCDGLAGNHPGWDDERLFQTARMINIAQLLKIVVEDYINHIAGHRLFHLDNSFAEKEAWYRSNHLALEFDLLYRWHSLVPDVITLAGKDYGQQDFRTNNALLEQAGMATVLQDSAAQAAGRIGLGNTPGFLMAAEYQMLKMGRDFRLRTYNEYRVQFGLQKLRDFKELTPDTALQDELRRLYVDIDHVELVVGLFAEEPRYGILFGELMGVMVGSDAFTQALTNPLLSTHIFNAKTFSDYGLDQINATSTLQDLVKRNVADGVAIKATFDFPLERQAETVALSPLPGDLGQGEETSVSTKKRAS